LTEMAGKIQTVLGAIDGQELGVTLPHEHFLVSTSVRFREPEETSGKHMARQPVNLETLGWIRYHPTSNLDNLQLTDVETAITEALRYRYAGGHSVVELTNIGIGRDPLGLARISRASGLNIVMGSGYYTVETVPNAAELSVNQMTDAIVSDIVRGVDATGVKAGIIGEIGTEWPIREFEKKSLQAAARAQRETGAPLNVHSGNSPDCPFEIVKILESAGADIEHLAIDHIDSRIFDHDTRVRLARTGCYMEWDCFSFEGWYPRRMVLSENNPVKCDMPCDAERVNQIMALIAEGYGGKILISHDHCLKHRLWKYGGPGYAHIIENVVPLMQAKGMLEQHIRTLMVDNPRRLLEFR